MQHFYIEDLFQHELPSQNANIIPLHIGRPAIITPPSAFMQQVSQYEFAIRTTDCDCAGETFHVHYAKPENIPNYLAILDQQIIAVADIWDCITLYKNLLIVHPFVDGNGRFARSMLHALLHVRARHSVINTDCCTTNLAHKNVMIPIYIHYYATRNYDQFLRDIYAVLQSAPE
jgi:fido (protein-threonine AMPylation protein)